MSKNAKCKLPLKGKVVFFATANINKFNEARSILSKYGVATGMLKLKGDEIQSENLKEIAVKSAQNAYRNSKLPIFVEDAGLFINVLSGFPGPYAAYVFHTIKNRGILKLMEQQKDRRASFQSIIAYCDDKNCDAPMCFFGESKGQITACLCSGFWLEPGRLFPLALDVLFYGNDLRGGDRLYQFQHAVSNSNPDPFSGSTAW